MIICVCHRVSDRDIAREAAAGSSFDELQFELGVGTCCGLCVDSARATHSEHAAGAGGCGARCLPALQAAHAPAATA